jgi:hypothetical protein
MMKTVRDFMPEDFAKEQQRDAARCDKIPDNLF